MVRLWRKPQPHHHCCSLLEWKFKQLIEGLGEGSGRDACGYLTKSLATGYR